MDQDDEALEELLRTASAAPPSERVQFRDDIAAFGSAAVSALASWLTDARLGAFAVRVLEAIGRRPDGRADAIRALAEARTTATSEPTRLDAAQSLANLNAGRDELPSARRGAAGGATRSPANGEDWSEHELEIAVAGYFEMLRMEGEGRPFNKSQRRLELQKRLDGRTLDSVKLRHHNTSAVLDERGLRIVEGFKPLRNYPRQLAEIVDRYVAASPWLSEADAADSREVGT